MYTFETIAIGVQNGLNKRWQSVDLTTPSVQSLLQDYRVLQISVTAQGDSQPQYLLLHTLAATWGSYTGTFAQLLSQHYATAALPTQQTPITRDRAIARYYDAFKQRMQLKPVDENNIEPPPVYDELLYDHLRIERPDATFEPSRAASNVLVNINGFYHRTQNIAERGLFVRDGYKSLRISNQNQAALWDFSPLGGFSLLSMPRVTPSNGAVQLNLGLDLTNKTVFFVIAGYVFLVDGLVVTQNGVSSFLINFAHEAMRLAARYYEAASYIDLSTVQQAAAGSSAGTVDTQLLHSDAAIQAWLALSQSFVVIVNRGSCYAQQRYIQRTGNPNQYLCYLDRDFSPFTPSRTDDPRLTLTQPNLPMVLELGRHPPYWCSTEGWVHSLTIYNNRIGQLLYETGHDGPAVQTSGASLPGSPGLLQSAFLLEFGSDVQNS